MNKRMHIEVRGCVQGVGFRPTVYRHAVEAGLSGFVLNALSGVVIEVEGPPARVRRFLDRLREAPPPQARIDALEAREVPPTGAAGPFVISRSERSGDVAAGMPPDLATCDDCRRELFDPADRRAGYAFINCTNCGPRFTIIRSLPYDRPRTSMAGFPMCRACEAEYTDPLDRRFDAQPNACAACGPRLTLRDAHGDELTGHPIAETARLLEQGETVALKGLGGFHLACRADDSRAVERLRRDKARPHKALAVMFASIEQVRRHCRTSPETEALLQTPAHPIVILPRRPDSTLSSLISPDTDDVGVFLPYTPLHLLLLAEISPLVMTSANRAEEPIISDFAELSPDILGRVAHFALDHDRPIVRRCDDSVVRFAAGAPLPIRRSRGYVPAPVRLPVAGGSVLACGGELKNTFCVTRGGDAFLSQHVGDLTEWAACRFYESAVRDLVGLLGVQPTVVAHDLHPDYLSTRFARKARLAPLFGVQHHHAHIAACLAENGRQGPAIGVALDGTGYGPDGTVWGGEFLEASLTSYRRAARFEWLRLPGGDAAVKHPVRIALSLLVTVFGPDEGARLAAELLPGLAAKDRGILLQVLRIPQRSPNTSSAGRLFDAVSSLLGLCDTITYEGQAAIRLQTAAERAGIRPDPAPVEVDAGSEVAVVSFAPFVRRVVRERRAGTDRREIAALFHATVAGAVVHTCSMLRERTGLEEVALSGGVFQNSLLTAWTIEALAAAGFRIWRHRHVPPNDAGVCYGQAAVAVANHGSNH